MFKPKTLLIALSLAMSFSVAHAADYHAVEDTNNAIDAESYTLRGQDGSLGYVDDWVLFTVTSVRDLTASIDPNGTVGIWFEKFDLYDQNRILIKEGNTSTSFPTLTFANLGAEGVSTDYYLKIYGPTNSVASYLGHINTTAPVDVTSPVSAVPEPEAYAMMLAGLGLMGFVARRRKL